jgi:phosphate transport system permease protein
MKSFWKSGSAFIWLTGLTAGIGLLMIGGLVVLILVNGLGIFWPSELEELTLKLSHILHVTHYTLHDLRVMCNV